MLKKDLYRLAGVTELEERRKFIGEEFIRVFEDEVKKIGTVNFLAQGVIYREEIANAGLDRSTGQYFAA